MKLEDMSIEQLRLLAIRQEEALVEANTRVMEAQEIAQAANRQAEASVDLSKLHRYDISGDGPCFAPNDGSYVLYDDLVAMLAAPQQHAQAALSDEQIESVWQSLPGIQIHNDAYSKGVKTEYALRIAFARAILATRHPAPVARTPVEAVPRMHWKDALRRSGANPDYHGVIAFTAKQLQDFVQMVQGDELQAAAPVASAPVVAVPMDDELPTFMGEPVNLSKANDGSRKRAECFLEIMVALNISPGSDQWKKAAEATRAYIAAPVAHDDLIAAEDKGYVSGLRVGLLEGASILREVYVNHAFHTGLKGLEDRCKEAEQVLITKADAELATPVAAAVQGDAAPFQQRVQPWMMACFGAEISADRSERNHRFFEEATELVQACGMTASEAHQLVDYTFGRDIGEPVQEVGGVMVTLAALCLANGMDMHASAETELARIWTKVEKIRAKQAAKPKHSPLPEHVAQRAASQPELNVWEGAMPESNGKSNFTAVLYRKNANGFDMFTDGFTIARSEYPDRVRYEADCVRHLIGELPDRPDILAYDDQKHSGYVAPAKLANQPDSVPTTVANQAINDALRVGMEGSERDVALKAARAWIVKNRPAMTLSRKRTVDEYMRLLTTIDAAMAAQQGEKGAT